MKYIDFILNEYSTLITCLFHRACSAAVLGKPVVTHRLINPKMVVARSMYLTEFHCKRFAAVARIAVVLR